MFYFFFFKQKTAYEMRISDWSSDVCSSDLEALAAYAEEIALARGGDARLDRAAGTLIDRLQAAPIESDARAIAERLALLFQGALLVRHSPPAVADAFCATRPKGEGGRSFGILPTTADIAAIRARQRSEKSRVWEDWGDACRYRG